MSLTHVLFLLLTTTVSVKAQFTFKSVLVDENKKPLANASVIIKDTYLAALSNSAGEVVFRNLSTGKYIVQVKCLGCITVWDTLEINNNTERNYTLKTDSKQLDEVIVNTTRVNSNTGIAFSNLTGDELSKTNLGKDALILLDQMPSVVVNSDAGNGVGYTGIRIRGSDQTRINVTINGVPVNDAESQGTFFVNMPDFISSVDNVQVQRGVGASSNGAGAFGGTINFQTNTLKPKAYGFIASSAGSFNTYKNTLAAGTGLLNNKFALDARASMINSDGYIDRATSRLGSLYLSAAYYGKKDVLKFIGFTGKEKTYQAWYYVDADSIKKGNRTDNPAGLYFDANGNPRYYKNETDNYQQDNYQLHYARTINNNLNFNIIAHYTKGRGYYEQYKQGETFAEYGINNAVTAGGDTITSTDLIRRLWLNNDFVGGIFNLNYTPVSNLAITLGGGFNEYSGGHFGRVMWAQYASNAEIDYEYYRNTAYKQDANVYLKINYNPIEKLYLFLDLQNRLVNYSFMGYDINLNSTRQKASLSFFNPKAGISYQITQKLNVYSSFAIGNKEPNRNDYVNSTPESRPKSEQLTDVEMGSRYASKLFMVQANIYHMQYKNQLVLNGEVNDVGAYNRINVPNSYRQGVELEAAYSPNKFISIAGNVTVSKNKIAEYKEFIDDYDLGVQKDTLFKNTDISFSPNLISSLSFIIKPFKGFEMALINKQVGKQYLDNTQNDNRAIKPYNVTELRFNYVYKFKSSEEIGFMFSIYNLTNTVYETNGYTYSYIWGGVKTEKVFLAPAAPLHFMGGITFKF